MSSSSMDGDDISSVRCFTSACYESMLHSYFGAHNAIPDARYCQPKVPRGLSVLESRSCSVCGEQMQPLIISCSLAPVPSGRIPHFACME